MYAKSFLDYFQSVVQKFEPGGLYLSLGRAMLPRSWNTDPVYDKKLVKIMENWYPVYDFQVKMRH